ncbi:hypothetical protein NA57DRAFT_72581 [Rhizodiscina lignyota]|uniref:Tat pathway signal sequence n=1 Tax=Rhizodiscina lignyota TaxID=1504668 RepID=A0A9P4MDM5_9PEZI|nr:hypothetical protein NA57DRAFT_72581 [Rhizodiscina lignyota]
MELDEKYHDEDIALRSSGEEESKSDPHEAFLPSGNKRRYVQIQVSIHRWMLHVLLLSINLLALIYLVLSLRESKVERLVYSPLNDIITPTREYRNITLGDRTPFTDAPGPAVDALWNSISVPPGDVGVVILNQQEKDKWGVTTVKLADGSGYAATIDVFHQLHCLDQLRQFIFNDTYKISPTEHPLWEDHIAHCIDSIRLSLQCSADVSLMPWNWIRGYALPWPDFRAKHECRNWDDIVAWALDRKLDTEKPGIWVHPELGNKDLLDESFTQNPLEDGKEIEYLEDNLY